MKINVRLIVQLAMVIVLSLNANCISKAMANSPGIKNRSSTYYRHFKKDNIKPAVSQENVRVYGRVLEAKDPPSPLAGINIKVKGSSKTVISDDKGVFEINVPKDAVLVFSMVGFKPKEYKVHAEQGNLIISLERNLAELDQVVVTGYSKQKVREIASSVSSVNMENVVNKPVVQLSQALQGGATGIQVSQSTGVVGGDQANIRIRGIATVGNAAPLVIVDGVPFDMNNLDPNTISTISVLKDAASASMYGARAANGVIIITTKRGVAGVPNIEYNGFYGIQQPLYRPDFVDAPTLMRMRNEALVNSGGNPVFKQGTIDSTASGADPIKYPNTNWTDLILRNTIPLQQHAILVSGGNTAARFALSINNTSQLGQLKELQEGSLSKYSRTTVRANTTVDLLKNLFVYMDVFASRSDQKEPYAGNRLTTDIYRRLYTVPPNVIPRYPDKATRPDYTYYGYFGESWNPVAMIERGGSITRQRDEVLINMRPQWQILPNLALNVQTSYRVTSGLDKNDQESYLFFNYYTDRKEGTDYGTQKGATLTGRETYFYWGGNLDYKLSYEKHSLNGVLGYTQEMRNYNSWNDVALRSIFAKAYYSYDDKYLLEAGIRRDGTSLFAEGNKWGYFPSVAIGWNIDRESFFKTTFVDSWKIRASYGVLGNNNIDPYLYQTTINTNGTENTIGNPDIKWEKSNVLNVATDISVKGFDATIEWFDKKTTDVIITPDPLFSGGIGTGNKIPPVNTASIRVRGIEASLKYSKTLSDQFRFNAGIGYTRNNSKVLKLIGNDLPIISSNTIMYIGSNMKENYGYATQGLLQEADIANPDVIKAIGQAAGDIHFIDVNGDKKINDLDRVPLGSTQPTDIFFGSLGFNYKGFDFDALVSGEAGAPAFYTGTLAIPFNGSEDGTPQRFQTDNWTPDNTGASLPRLTPTPGSNANFSDYFMINGRFLRVRYIQLGYTFSSKITDKIRGKMLRVYLNAQNPFTFSAVKHMDPEIRGDQTKVPLMKIFSVGLNLKF